MKKIFTILLSALAAIVFLFLAGRYGWRVFGFATCDTPDSNYVESVTLEGSMLTVRGSTGSSMTAYVGHIEGVSNNKLYLGLKHNAFLGFFERLGAFSVTVENARNIDEIYLKGGDGERLVWTKRDGVIKNAPVPAATVVPAGEEAPTEDAVAADEPIA